uniref:dihydrofolate reductase family protein n=1 Tax=Lachnoclostridium phocaeense TaxID=1871021 RepID=UPI0026DCE4AF|nr:dihydrofolate reductase family protein [Lachnoclostridium phocaeense]
MEKIWTADGFLEDQKAGKQGRPYVICHILSALDGKITGTFMRTESAAEASEQYADIRSGLHARAWLYGTSTTREFIGGSKAVLKERAGNVPDGDFIAEAPEKFYFVSVDTEGIIGWQDGTFRKEGRPDAHVIEVLTEKTPLQYRSYLRERGVSYILAGKDSLDCREAVRKLGEYWGIEAILVCGGGTINWTFVQQGAADELSLVLAPAADGESETVTVFERSPLLTASVPVEFALKQVQVLEKGALWMRYGIKQ